MPEGLYRRGAIWWGRIQHRGREHRKSLRTTDKRVARERRQRWKAELQALEFGEKPPRPWAAVVRRFMHEHYPAIRPSSATRYTVSLKNLSRAFPPDMAVQAIGRAKLSEFEAMRRAEGASAPTIRRDLVCLSAALAFCEEWEWIEHNPVPAYLRRRRRRGLKESPGRERYLSEAEEAALIEAANEPCRTAIVLSIDTGLRDQELFALTWDMIDQARAIIRLPAGDGTKSGRGRAVPLAQRSAQALARLPRHIASRFVFCHDDGRRIGRTVKGFKAAARRAGIEDLRWHDLRRTAGCRWLQRDGRRMEEVSQMLGHADLRTTQKSYAFLDGEAVAQKAAQAAAG